jgi:hypothetical protein
VPELEEVTAKAPTRAPRARNADEDDVDAGLVVLVQIVSLVYVLEHI